MKKTVYSITGEKLNEVNLPNQFNEEYHPDLIKRAVLAVQANKRQPYGAHPEAGKRYSAKISRRRRDYKTSYGHGISRVPRKTIWRRGMQFGWIGAFAPGTVGGRRAHPPKAEKVWEQKINIRERRKAIRSALGAVLDETLVRSRGHIIPDNYPFIVESKLESLQKTKDAKNALDKLGFKKELERVAEKKLRAGKGKIRGRKYRARIGPLIVVSSDCPLSKSAGNIPGTDIINIKNINAELLAPGTMPGRLTIFTDKALEILEKENLFANKRKNKK